MSNQEVQQNNNSLSAADQIPQDVIVSLVLNGDLSRMTENQKVDYYNSFCKHLKLNPLTQPFQIISMKGKLVMYAKKDCTDQLRKIYGVSVDDLTTNQVGDIYMVTVKVKDKSGRTDMAMGAVSLTGKLGEDLANALMKAETKAKRRATLSICGLGILDETEMESISTADVQSKAQGDGTMNIDVVNPTQENIDKYGVIPTMVRDQRVPEDLFGGQPREEFIAQFGQEFMSGSMPVSKADSVLNTLKGYCQ